MNKCNSIFSLKNEFLDKHFFCLFWKNNFHTSPICKNRKSSTFLINFNKKNIAVCEQNEKNNDNAENTALSEEIKRETNSIQHVFKWGIGNKFRSDPENRFHPVHLLRPKEVTIKKSYFDSTNENIKYEDLNEQWEVFWFENNKLNAKPFPIKKYGIEAAKKEAFKFYETLQSQNRINPKPKHESGVEGVYYDVVTNCWIALYRSNKFPVCKSFSAEYHGFETAKQMAIDRVNKCKR
ncbi:hypothetical protein YYC_04641 [Plasmodium yoelii 17X]|uniref:Uncharacterized protein n=1 Tax=Plasmodium yoelii 17X TaxID=1323249 RepID=V7PE44_PLAYE|nr:hypothetical protein YYC_04641 [Plasmodium yoelii 17X]